MAREWRISPTLVVGEVTQRLETITIAPQDTEPRQVEVERYYLTDSAWVFQWPEPEEGDAVPGIRRMIAEERMDPDGPDSVFGAQSVAPEKYTLDRTYDPSAEIWVGAIALADIDLRFLGNKVPVITVTLDVDVPFVGARRRPLTARYSIPIRRLLQI